MVYTLMLEVRTDKPGPGPSLKDLLIPHPPANHLCNPTEYKKEIQNRLCYEYNNTNPRLSCDVVFLILAGWNK